MKTKLYLIFLLFISSVFMHSCAPQKLGWKYFKNYTDYQKTAIKNHWVQYFQEDIYNEIEPQINMFPIKIDSYGGLYPGKRILSSLNKKDFKAGFSDKNLLSYSMYTIFKNKKVEENIELLGDEYEKGIYKEFIKIEKNSDISIYSFYDKWNKYHDSILIENLKIAAKTKKKILFFVHGYNVPYGLANVQAASLIRLMKDSLEIDTSEVLLVPVFWSSNSQKRNEIDCKDKFDIRDRFNLKNVRRFTHYSNRAYFAAIALRRILNNIEEDTVSFREKEILLFSHSLGATVLTTAFINTVQKLQYKKNIKNKVKNKKGSEIDCGIINDMNLVNRRIILNLKAESLPKNKYNIFISAGAIPGINTFIDIDTDIIKNKFFHVTINSKDKMLTKFGMASKVLSATTLGMGKESTSCIKEFFGKYQNNFNTQNIQTEKNIHNMFYYMEQKTYRDFIYKWYSHN